MDRAFYYYGRIMQIVSGYGILKLLGLSWYWLFGIAIISVPIIILIVYIDITFVMPKEQEYLWSKNPTVGKILDKKGF